MDLSQIPQKALKLKKNPKLVFNDWLANHLSQGTRDTYITVLRSFEKFLNNQNFYIADIKNLTLQHIIAYREHLNTRGLSNKSKNLHLATLSSCFEEFYRQGLIEENFVRRLKRPPSDNLKLKYHLTDDELSKIAQAFTPNQIIAKTFFILMATTAQRATSLLNLKKSDIHYLENQMVISIKIKSGRQKLLPVPAQAEFLLKDLIEEKLDHQYLFSSNNSEGNKPMTLRNFNQILKTKAKKAKIDKVISSHTMRRTKISSLIMKGVSLDRIKDSISFHQNLNTLQSYRSNDEYDLKSNPLLDEPVIFRSQVSKRPRRERSDFMAIELFSGSGGMSLGIEEAGFEIACAIDNNKTAIETFNLNHRKVGKVADIRNLNGEKIFDCSKLQAGKVDLICGGPPCQSFSRLNNNPSEEQNDLVLEFGRLVKEIKPKFFMMENVVQITQRGDLHLTELKNMLNEYTFYPHVYNAADYGVAQNRRRFILVGKHQSIKSDFKIPQIHSKGKTIREVIGDLPEPTIGSNSEFYNHELSKISELNKLRISHVPENGSWQNIPYHLLTKSKIAQDFSHETHFDVYGRMSWDDLAPTLTTSFTSFTCGRFAHPVQDRAITAREGARIQGFPDWFEFKGNKGEISKQIGNAVPPPLAKAIGLEILKVLKIQNL